ncbi:MAG: ABC transporter substrate-binding protein [Zoogloea sp.]|nr:ABC transporter substrate-binding protein [Zoogloea sp.]
MPRACFLLSLMLVVWLAACSQEAPLVVGFLGGLSDRNSDVGESGLHGVQLAVEQTNRAGGVAGRKVRLVARDDAATPATAVRAAEELAALKVEAVIGPFSSGMAAAAVPVLARTGTLAISPTITAMELHGKDDNLIRINRTTRDNASDYAQTLLGMGQKRMAIAYDVRNQVFTESWLNEFRRFYTELGGVLVVAVPYESRVDLDFARVVADMVSARPDALLFISGGIDVARLAHQARKRAPELPIAAAEWGASLQMLELGGEMVEGLVIIENYNRHDGSERYAAFREAYFQRFNKRPDYSAVCAYDAAMVLFTAMSRRERGESAKQAVLKYGPYQGLQQEIVFDANGDTQRQVFFARIRNGEFQPLNHGSK